MVLILSRSFIVRRDQYKKENSWPLMMQRTKPDLLTLQSDNQYNW
jgi:hypothetical protein